MESTPQQIENALISIPDNARLMAFLAPQEIERLTAVVWEVLSKMEKSMGVQGPLNYDDWSKKASQAIGAELKVPEDAFGIMDFEHRLNISDFLRKYYDLQYKSVNNSANGLQQD